MSKLLLLCLMLLPLWGQTIAQKTRLQSIKPTDTAVTIRPALQQKLQQKASGTTANFLLSKTAASALQDAGTPEYWPDRVFVKLKDQSNIQLQTYRTKATRPKAVGNKISSTFQRYEASSVAELPVSAKLSSTRRLYEVVVDKPEGINNLLSELNAMPEVAYAERVPYYVTSGTPNDPYYTSNSQYAMNLTKAVEAFGIHTGTTKTLLAIIDDAILVTHPDLAANIDLSKSYDVANNDNDANPPSSGINTASSQVFSHGTHCAGIAGAVTNNGVGIGAVSNNNISIMGVKCTSDETANTRAVERAYEGVIYAINQGARVLSLSWGGTGSSTTYQNLFNEAAANSIVVVAAAGNEAVETKTYPAAYSNVIAVASSDSKDMASSFTNYGTWIDLTAPGSAIMSTVAGGTSGSYTSYSGTSMATPMVAGMVAYMLSENPDLTPQAVLDILKSSADPIDTKTGQATKYAGKLGAGRINVLKAIQTIQGLSNTVAPSAITNLTASNTTETTVKLSWTSPAVNGTEAATLYDVRYATTPITTTNFASATRTTASVVPALPGAMQELLIKGLVPGTTYYIAIMARSFYGDGTLSNVVSTKTLAAPRLQFDLSTITFSLNREIAKTASQNLVISNVGSEPLQYTATVIPASGTNLLSYDKADSDSEGSVGLGGSSFYTAVKFVAGPKGFLLTHVQNHIGNATDVASAAIGIRIFKGGTSPADATLLTTQTSSSPVTAGGSLLAFQLQEPQQFQPGEVFWIDFMMPQGLDYPQGYDNTGAKPGTFFISGDGRSYSDAQPMAEFLKTAAFKVRALSTSGFTLTPAAGTVASAQSQALTLSINTDGLVNGTYQAHVQIVSNDPIEPIVNRPVTVTVTGGQPAMVVENTTLDFGSLFAYASVTRQFIVQNTGVADLEINAATFAGGVFSAEDFILSPAVPATVKPGTEQVFNVTFKPAAVGSMAATLTLTSNAPATPSVVINLSGTATTPPVAVTPTILDVTIDAEDKATAATEAVTIRNNGDESIDYTLQIQQAATQTLKYDADRAADSFVGLNSTTATFSTAMKFNVTSPSFTLLQVQNYYRTEAVANRNVTMKVYKGGTTPTNGTLLSEQLFNSDSSANGGAFITIPLQQAHHFVKNDVFWVVFAYTGVPYPQGYTTGSAGSNRNFYSTNGTSWTAYNTNTFKIRALGAPTWITTTPASGTIAAGEEADVAVQLNAADLNIGLYKAKVLVKTDKAEYPELGVDVNLVVRGLPVADFTTAYTRVLTGTSITFQNTSTSADAYEWEFEGAETVTSTEASPTVKYKTPGTYNVSLIAKKANGVASEPLLKEAYITVADNHCEELNTPFAGTLATYQSGDDYTTGNNTRGHLAKANLFTFDREGYSYLTGTKIRFGYAAADASATATVKVAVWSVADGIPGEIIASKNIKVKDIAADIAAQRTTEVTFDAAVPVTGDFMVGVVLNNEGNSQVAIATHTTAQKPAMGVQGWEQLQNGSWSTLLAGWGTDLAMFIQPALSRKLDPFVASIGFIKPSSNPEACVGTEIQTSAAQTTGATRLEWVHEGADEARTEDDQVYLTYNTPGTYTITLHAYDACNARTSVSKTITIAAFPEADITASGTTTLCKGGTVTLAASEGASYLWSTGETTRAITVAEAGEYTVTITNAGGCQATSTATAVHVSELPTATITASGDLSFCQGGSVTLTASEGSSYLWSTGETTRAILATEADNYTVTVTNGSGCEAISEAVAVEVKALPTNTIAASGATSICQGGSVTLTAAEGATYLWSNGESTRSITVASAGSYTVTVTNSSGCHQTSEAVAVTVTATPDRPVITQTAGILTSSAATGNQWFLNGTAIEGATAQIYTITQHGTYTVQVTSNSCVSLMSEELLPVTLTGLPEATAGIKELEVYPNPTSGAFTLTFSMDKGTDVSIRVISATGQLVMEEKLSGFRGTYEKQIDLQQAASGIYILQVQYADKVETRKVVLKR